MDGESKNVHNSLNHMWGENGVPPRFIRHIIKFLIEYGVYQPWMELLSTSIPDYDNWTDPVLLSYDRMHRVKAMINAPISHVNEKYSYEDSVIYKKFITATRLDTLIEHWKTYSTHFDMEGKKIIK